MLLSVGNHGKVYSKAFKLYDKGLRDYTGRKMKATVFLSQVTGTSRRTLTQTLVGRRRLLLAMHFISQAILTSGKHYKSLRLGPEPHCQPW